MSESNHGRKRQAPAGSSNHSDTNEDHSTDDLSSLPGTATYVIEDDGSFTQKTKAQRKRKRFDAKRRIEVAEVRKRGACEQCRLRKVRCTHVLQSTDTHPDSAPAPTPSPQLFLFDFEPQHGTTLDPEARQWPQPDDSQPLDTSSAEVVDLFGQLPTERRDKLARNLYDIDTVLEDGSRGKAVKSFADTATWAYDLPWALAVTNDKAYSQPSTSYPYSNTNLSVDISSSPFTPASTNAGLLPPNIENGDNTLLALRNWSGAKSSRGVNPRRDHVQGNPRVHREPVRWSSSQMQRHLSTRTVDGTPQRSPSLFNINGSNHEFASTATDLSSSFQRPAHRPDPIMDDINSLTLQAAMPQSQPQLQSSPNPSLVDRFEHNLNISPRSYSYPTSNGVPEEVLPCEIAQNQSEQFLTTHILNTRPAFERNWDTESQSLNIFDSQPLNFYENVASTPTDFNPQSASAYSDMPMQTWSEQASSTFIAQTGGFENVCGPSGFQSDVQFQQPQYPMNNDLLLDFPVPPGHTKPPSIIVTPEDDQIMLNANHNPDFVLTAEIYNTNPISSQRNAYQPSLDLSTLSSSGASEGLISPVDAPGLTNDKYTDDNWDTHSTTHSTSHSLWSGLGNMDI